MEDIIMRKKRTIVNATLIAIFSIIFVSCLKNAPPKVPFQSFSPACLGDGWEIAEPSDVGIDGEALKGIYRYVHEDDNVWQIRSLLVFRNNKLVAESYMKDNNDRTNPRVVWSCTKQVVGILAGIAVDQGLISIDNTIADYLPQVSSTQHADKKDITIEHLLTMKSGINFNNDKDNEPLKSKKVSNILDYVLGFGMQSSPGSMYRYKESDPQIISSILEERTGKTTRDWAREVLFDKIGIERLEWNNYNGITMGCWGILATPRELGKIGQLVINDGKWNVGQPNEEQIVSSSWISDMTSIKVPNAVNGYNLPDIGFGYLWWKDSKRDITYMWGHGGQFVFNNRAKNLIVVIMSEGADKALTISQGFSIYDRVNGITK
jgi:CubicO group peptidase (beta-lactamase class C family)